MKKHLSALLYLLMLLLLGCDSKPEIKNAYEFSSPEENVKVGFYLDKMGDMAYTVHYKNRQVIFPSLLGLELKQGGFLGRNMVIKHVSSTEIDESYPVVAGKSEMARNWYREMKFELEEMGEMKRRFILEFRVFEDGAAFRYLVPDQPGLTSYDLLTEHTQFQMCRSIVLWPTQYPSYTGSFEKLFVRSSLQEIVDTSIVGLPLSFQMQGMYEGCITEANLFNYPGMFLHRNADSGDALAPRFAPNREDPSLIMKSDSAFTTPWRVVMVAEKLIDLIPSNIIMNLNEPSEIKDPSWIKPGRVAWDWWNNAQVEGVDFEGGMNDATMEYFIDFASEFNLEYMLIDAGWYGDHRDTLADVTTSIPEIDIPHLIQYASERGVNLILWLNWKPLMLNMEKAFATYREWGIRGVKIDYMNRDDQEMVNLYHKMVVEAARHELMVDFHGAYKPAGIRRTWPNLMTREGVLGLEHLKWSDLPTADHNVTIPFTRMLAGPMDYTPGGFDHAHPGEFEIKWGEPMALGTRCHQLAMYVVYESPLQMLSDHPGNYRGQPGAEFLMEVPASWDETRAIDGEIGEFVIMARRSGVQWFLGAMTNSEPRELEVTLDFLDPGINYSATLYNDSEKTLVDANILEKIKAEVGNGQVWKLTLAPGGGFVAKISPKL